MSDATLKLVSRRALCHGMERKSYWIRFFIPFPNTFCLHTNDRQQFQSLDGLRTQIKELFQVCMEGMNEYMDIFGSGCPTVFSCNFEFNMIAH
jgi:hypothetical protein